MKPTGRYMFALGDPADGPVPMVDGRTAARMLRDAVPVGARAWHTDSTDPAFTLRIAIAERGARVALPTHPARFIRAFYIRSEA